MELSLHTSKVIEFTKTSVQLTVEKVQDLYVDSATATDTIVQGQDAAVQTKEQCDKSMQTEKELHIKWTAKQEHDINEALRILEPKMEAALREGYTPLPSNVHWLPAANEQAHIQTYQKLALTVNTSYVQIKALACWLAVYTNNAPALVVSTIAAHDNWCEHMEQTLQLFVPKRSPRSDFVHFQLVKSVSLKACVQQLCTNNFDKSIFAVSLYDSHIYVWQHELNTNELKELYNHVVSEHGCALALCWAAADILLTTHATGYVLRWRLAEKMTLEYELAIKVQDEPVLHELSTVLSITPYDFVVGTKAGYIYHCRHQTNASISNKQSLDIAMLHKQPFAVTKLNKSLHDKSVVIISCDLSGQVIVHDLLNPDDELKNLNILMPLPFKNDISCPPAKELNMMYACGNDGALECFHVESRTHSTVKGVLMGTGAGNFVACSDNGSWIVCGLYGNDLQIFYVKQ